MLRHTFRGDMELGDSNSYNNSADKSVAIVKGNKPDYRNSSILYGICNGITL